MTKLENLVFSSTAYIPNPLKVGRLKWMVCASIVLAKPSGSDRNVQESSSPGLQILNFSIWDQPWLSCGSRIPTFVLYFIFVTTLHGLLGNMLWIGPSLRPVNEKFLITILFVKVSFNCCKILGTLGSRGRVTRPDGMSLLSNGHAH